jgi:vesicle transport through interaction with t-SNAREs protein 1
MDATAIERFRRYEENFLNSTRIINRSLQRLGETNGNVDLVISISVEIESELSETEGYLKAMDVEQRTVPNQEKRSTQEKVQGYRSEYREMLQKFKTAKYNAEAVALRGGGNASRNKLINANARLDNSTATLEQSRQLVAQTEGIGTTILTDMTSQREVLLEADEKVFETRNYTKQASGILTLMENRAFYQKICIYAWILILFAGIVCVIYFGFIAKSSSSTT